MILVLVDKHGYYVDVAVQPNEPKHGDEVTDSEGDVWTVNTVDANVEYAVVEVLPTRKTS